MEGILKTEPEDSQDIINFQSYIDAVKKKRIEWDLFVQLMLDLSNTSKNRQKLLISILLNELRNYIDQDYCQQKNCVENNVEKLENVNETTKHFKEQQQSYESSSLILKESIIQGGCLELNPNSTIHEEELKKSKTENSNYDDIIEDEVSYIYNLPDDENSIVLENPYDENSQSESEEVNKEERENNLVENNENAEEIAINDHPNAEDETQMNTDENKDEKIFDTVETSATTNGTKIFSKEWLLHNDYFESASKTVCEMCNYTYNTQFSASRDRSTHWLKKHFRQKFNEEIGEKMKISFPRCPFDNCEIKNKQRNETHLINHIFLSHGLQKKYFYEEMKNRKDFELTNIPNNFRHEPFLKVDQNSDQDFNLANAVDEVFSKKAKLGRLPKIHQCKMCHKILKTRQHLIKHVEEVHCAKKDKRCHICDKGFKRQKDLEIHIKRMHNESRDFICDKCGKGYVKRYDLRMHTTKATCKVRKPIMDKLEEAYKRCEMLNSEGKI